MQASDVLLEVEAVLGAIGALAARKRTVIRV